MSFFTCFCDFPQKLHFSSSPPSPNLATIDEPPAVPLRGGRDRTAGVGELPGGDHLVAAAVLLGLTRGQDEVAVGVRCDLLLRLAGVDGDDVLEEVAHAHDLLRLDLDVRGLAGPAAPRLVEQHPGVREGEALGRRARPPAARPPPTPPARSRSW